METLSALEARRLALTAQGFAGGRPEQAGLPHLRAMAARLQAIQIDTVNVLVRAHYLPLFARLGPYDPALLDRLAYDERSLFEYEGHALSFLPIELYPLFRWRMRLYEGHAHWKAAHEPAEAALREIRDRGPLAASDMDPGGERIGTFWRWTPARMALTWLHKAGRVAVAGRRGFQPLFDLTERVIPDEVRSRPAPDAEDAKRELLYLAAQALGVATAKDLSDYFSLDSGRTRSAERAVSPRPRRGKDLVAGLVDAGRLTPVKVEGWSETAYIPPEARPSSVAGRALMSPFDSLLWHRKRVERLFSFVYRLEMYVPKEQRQHGYYTLPFLLGDHLVARVDLKADRKAGVLRVQSAFAETPDDAPSVAGELAAELWTMARWLSLERIEADGRGDLAGVLATAVLRPPD